MEKKAWFRTPALWALLLALLHFGLAQWYAGTIPYRTAGATNALYLVDIGAPDERAHANNIAEIIRTGAWPVMRADDPLVRENYQSHQMPLFYAALAQVARLAGETNHETQAFGQLVRRWNSLFGAVGVVFTFALAWILTGSLRAAIGAGSLIALLPMNLALSGSVNNDALLIAFSAAASFLVGWNMVKGWSLWAGLALAAVIAGAFWTKSHGLLWFPILPLAWIVTEKAQKGHWILPVVALVALGAMAGPAVQRNLKVYGEPLPQKVFAEVFPSSFAPDHFERPNRVARWASGLVDSTVDSFTGAFGYFDIQYPAWIPDVVMWIVVIVGGMGLIRLLADGRGDVLIPLAAFVALCILGYVVFNIKYLQPQARYIFPALPAIALAFGAGWLIFPRWLGPVLVTGSLWLNLTTLPWLAESFRSRVEIGREWVRQGVAEERKPK